MRTSHKDKKSSSSAVIRTPKKISPEISKNSTNIFYLGLGLASLVGSSLLNRYIQKKVLGSALGVWGSAFLLLGLYSKIAHLETELKGSKKRILH